MEKGKEVKTSSQPLVMSIARWDVKKGEELTTSTDDLSLSLPLSFDKKVWLSFRSNCRARLLKAILEEFLEVFAGGLEGQRSILEEIV